MRFKDPLYRCAAALFGVEEKLFKRMATDRDRKDRPLEKLRGLSPREVLIETSERIIKPYFGNRYFGERAAKNLHTEVGTVFSDGGFHEEIQPIAETVGLENLYIVYLVREGCSFEGDSRSYILAPPLSNCIWYSNSGTIRAAAKDIIRWATHTSK